MEQEPFRIRAYGFRELAQLYLPNIKPHSASLRLKAWTEGSPGLKEKLGELGFKPRIKVLTPEMVRVIVEHLGEP